MRILPVAAALLALPIVARAQTADWGKTSAPKVLGITTETVKIGQAGAHRKIESGWRRAFIKARYPSWFLGLGSVSGPSTMIFLTGFDSLQAWQKDDDDQGANAWLAAEQDTLSIEDAAYLAGHTHEYLELVRDATVEARFPFGATRCVALTRVEVEPGQIGAFREWLKRQIAARGPTLPHVATYRTLAGGSLASFVVVEARPTRAAFAGGGGLDWDGAPGLRRVTRDLYEPDPLTSHVSGELAKGHEKFWFPEE